MGCALQNFPYYLSRHPVRHLSTANIAGSGPYILQLTSSAARHKAFQIDHRGWDRAVTDSSHLLTSGQNACTFFENCRLGAFTDILPGDSLAFSTFLFASIVSRCDKPKDITPRFSLGYALTMVSINKISQHFG